MTSLQLHDFVRIYFSGDPYNHLMFLDPYWFPLVVVFELVVVELFHFQIAWMLVSWRLKHVPMIDMPSSLAADSFPICPDLSHNAL